MPIYQLREPQRLTLSMNGTVCYGYTQDWYTDSWQARAGCGSTTATSLLAYHLVRDGYWEALLTQAAVMRRMQEIWDYVTPGHGGLFKTRWLVQGLRRYLAEHRLPYRVDALPVSVRSAHRPEPAAVKAFIAEALAADSPVAFLNRHRGAEPIDTWHWVPIVSLDTEQEPAVAEIYDETTRKFFAPENWVRDTLLGGGFVSMRKI